MTTTFVCAPRALFAACALLAGTAFANGPPSPQKGAAGLVTAFHVRDQLPWHLDVLTFEPRDIVDRALRLLAPVTSPSQVLATPAGVTVGCPVAGSLVARIAPRAPNVVRLQWVGCVTEIYGWNHTLNGVGEVTLLAYTFSPATVAGIRLGDRTSDLVDGVVMIQSSQTVPDVHTRNVRMTGVIPLARAGFNDIFRGTSVYELSGFYEERSHFQVGGAGEQLFESILTLSADDTLVTRTYDIGTNTVDDIRIRGKLSYVSVFPETPFGPEQRYSYRLEPQGLRVRLRSLPFTGDQTFAIDGTIRVEWPETLDLQCHDYTDFNFRTTVPANRPQRFYGTNTFDAGEIWIDGDARARFSLVENEFFSEEMHVDLRVHGRNFPFVVQPYGGWGALYDAARCDP